MFTTYSLHIYLIKSPEAYSPGHNHNSLTLCH
nr:MAG TPA: hypothetical protein [Caudoviricetes sp.]